jgi:hypothetical protein
MKKECPNMKIKNELPVTILSPDQIVLRLKQIHSLSVKFLKRFDELRLPIRYALMSLLS